MVPDLTLIPLTITIVDVQTRQALIYLSNFIYIIFLSLNKSNFHKKNLWNQFENCSKMEVDWKPIPFNENRGFLVRKLFLSYYSSRSRHVYNK